MNQEKMIEKARIHIVSKYGSARKAARALDIWPSFLSERLKGGMRLPKALLDDIGYEESVTAPVYTYAKKSEEKR